MKKLKEKLYGFIGKYKGLTDKKDLRKFILDLLLISILLLSSVFVLFIVQVLKLFF